MPILQVGDQLKDFRGDDCTFLGVTRLAQGSSTGRVLLRYNAYGAMEFFPSVVNAVIDSDGNCVTDA